jgi:hypothetical protein
MVTPTTSSVSGSCLTTTPFSRSTLSAGRGSPKEQYSTSASRSYLIFNSFDRTIPTPRSSSKVCSLNSCDLVALGTFDYRTYADVLGAKNAAPSKSVVIVHLFTFRVTINQLRLLDRQHKQIPMLRHFGMALKNVLPTFILQNNSIALDVRNLNDCHIGRRSLWNVGLLHVKNFRPCSVDVGTLIEEGVHRPWNNSLCEP